MWDVCWNRLHRFLPLPLPASRLPPLKAVGAPRPGTPGPVIVYSFSPSALLPMICEMADLENSMRTLSATRTSTLFSLTLTTVP